MKITDKPAPDPVAAMPVIDAYMRWALQSAEQVIGAKGMVIVLREAKLEHFRGNYPPNELKANTGTRGDYTNLCVALLNFFGRAGRSMNIRIGRISAKLAVEQQAAAFGLNTLVKASRVLPLRAQQKAGLVVMQTGLKRIIKSAGSEWALSVEDRGDTLAYIDQQCPMCAGKESDEPICWVHVGVLQESAFWLTGKNFEIKQTAARSMGDPACVWEVGKTPIE